MMTNVDLEGFRDWTDEELKEAMNFIEDEIANRKKEKVNNALRALEIAFFTLKQACGDDITLLFNRHCNYHLEEIYLEIEEKINERYK